MQNILFVNHRQKQCGVGEMGSRYYRNLSESQHYNCFYIDIDQLDEYLYWFNQIKPAAVVWNYYSTATMPWLTQEIIKSKQSESRQLAIYHELPLESLGFDLILHQDPNPPDDTFPNWALPRSIPVYDKEVILNSIPKFGSFGFGLGGKGFDRVVETVNREYDKAEIHFHIPFAYFGDTDGRLAKSLAKKILSIETKPNINVSVDHEWWEEDQLLDWLASNTCNCFFYEPQYGRGISGTTDYALAVKRPLAITHSWQFRHLWTLTDSFCIENHSLREIVARGSSSTDRFRKLWSREAFVKSFEDALGSLGI